MHCCMCVATHMNISCVGYCITMCHFYNYALQIYSPLQSTWFYPFTTHIDGCLIHTEYVVICLFWILDPCRSSTESGHSSVLSRALSPLLVCAIHKANIKKRPRCHLQIGVGVILCVWLSFGLGSQVLQILPRLLLRDQLEVRCHLQHGMACVETRATFRLGMVWHSHILVIRGKKNLLVLS